MVKFDRICWSIWIFDYLERIELFGLKLEEIFVIFCWIYVHAFGSIIHTRQTRKAAASLARQSLHATTKRVSDGNITQCWPLIGSPSTLSAKKKKNIQSTQARHATLTTMSHQILHLLSLSKVHSLCLWFWFFNFFSHYTNYILLFYFFLYYLRNDSKFSFLNF